MGISLALFNRLKSDESLMLAYQNGDTGAFELLYRRHKDGLFAFLFRSYPRAAVVEELAQDTWVAVINAVERYTPDARFRTWLYQIAHNRLVDHWRRADNQHTELASAPEPLTTDNCEIEDLQRAVVAALAQLPREQKDALLLHEQGFTLADIAQITDTGVETVKSRMRYARNHLREKLGDEI